MRQNKINKIKMSKKALMFSDIVKIVVVIVLFVIIAIAVIYYLQSMGVL
jgi:hypothetical protein